MDFPRLRSLNKYWSDHPPTHVLLKRLGIFVGVEKPPKNNNPETDPLAQLLMSDTGHL